MYRTGATRDEPCLHTPQRMTSTFTAIQGRSIGGQSTQTQQQDVLRWGLAQGSPFACRTLGVCDSHGLLSKQNWGIGVRLG
jgi:hypothetical protein